jgi:hypothetical protein
MSNIQIKVAIKSTQKITIESNIKIFSHKPDAASASEKYNVAHKFT